MNQIIQNLKNIFFLHLIDSYLLNTETKLLTSIKELNRFNFLKTHPIHTGTGFRPRQLWTE